MLEFTYHLDIISNSYPFGVQTDKRLYILEENTELSTNPELLNLIDSVPSFRVFVDSGSGTARLERGYWYVYKKRKGVLYKQYLGKSATISEYLLTEVVRTVNTMVIAKIEPTSDTHQANHIPVNGCKTIKEPLIYTGESIELAGHKKDVNHLQGSLIFSNQELTIANQALESLQATYEQNQIDYMVLHQRLRDVESDRLIIIAEKDKALNDLKEKELEASTKSKQIEWFEDELLKNCNEHIKEIEQFKTFERLTKEVTADKNESILKLLSDKDATELKLINLNCEVKQADNTNLILDKYRKIAKGKNKQSHPRYSYLIDFLADIDK